MTQNVSTAVMQRRVEAHDSLDDFPTPPWATRALCEQLEQRGMIDSDMTAREPCANRGYMVRPMLEYFAEVDASDVHDYGAGFERRDYLFGPLPAVVDWTFMNPPFRLAGQFIRRAIDSSWGVAALVRCAFLEGGQRYRDLFADTPPKLILQFVERVPMVKGRYDHKASTATAYTWLIWQEKVNDALFGWIPPCRKRLERPSDYA